MTPDERTRVEELRRVPRLTFDTITWLLDLVERQEARIERLESYWKADTRLERGQP